MQPLSYHRGNAIILAAVCVLNTRAGAAAQPPLGASAKDFTMTFTVRIDRGQDIGQNFGALFEVKTANEKLTIGAGFLGLYNTRFRADRHTVHFFVRPADDERTFTTERLPRPTRDAGTYMFALDGVLHACGYTHDTKVRLWNEAEKEWDLDPNPVHARMRLGDGTLLFHTHHVEYNGRSILSPPDRGAFHQFYYAQKHLFFYHTFWADKTGYRAYETDTQGFSKLYACPWAPDDDAPVDVSQAVVLTLPVVGETPFAYGQLGQEVLTCSNIGGVYAFDGKTWRTLVKPVLNKSYQIYSMLNFYDRLLMGHYPTGLLYEYDGRKVKLLEGWPPRMPGVSPHAREAQTTVIYGGDLFVGVWPWGELWRYNPDGDRWTFVRRMFTHPPVTDATTHPYENECIRLKLVTNQWGQRVTSLVPVGDSLFVSTSAKWPCKWEPRFDFLGGDKWKEYGAVTRLRMPGSLSAPVSWTHGPTTLRFTVGPHKMSIAQDGHLLASTKLDAAIAAQLAAGGGLKDVAWGEGVFGPFVGVSLQGNVETRGFAR